MSSLLATIPIRSSTSSSLSAPSTVSSASSSSVSEPSPNANIETIPSELLERIFEFLPNEDQARSRPTCKLFDTMIHTSNVDRIRREFASNPPIRNYLLRSAAYNRQDLLRAMFAALPGQRIPLEDLQEIRDLYREPNRMIFGGTAPLVEYRLRRNHPNREAIVRLVDEEITLRYPLPPPASSSCEDKSEETITYGLIILAVALIAIEAIRVALTIDER